MCPDIRPGLRSPRTPNRQGGFLMPVAVFIIVAMGLFALMMVRTTTQVNTAAVQELVSTQAFYAAESGAQAGMSQLFYPDASSKAAVDGQCAGMGTLNLDFSGVEGLNICAVEVSCVCTDENGGPCSSAANYSFYTLTSVGQCGSGAISAERRLQVSAFMERN